MNEVECLKSIREASYLIFKDSLEKYGPSFFEFRLTSITDQIFIKLLRIKQYECAGKFEVNESVEETYMAAINYSIIAVMMMKGENLISTDQILNSYKAIFDEVENLRLKKNSDYSDAWKKIRISSMTDIMIVKIRRLKTLEDIGSHAVASDGKPDEVLIGKIKDCYVDILNYSLYSLLRLNHC